MRNTLAIAALTLVLAACGTAAQQADDPRVTAEQVASTTVAMVDTNDPCRVEASVVPADATLELTASDACIANTTIPFTVEADWGTVLDGGVYAGGSPTIFWLRPGDFEIVAHNGNSLGTISVPE